MDIVEKKKALRKEIKARKKSISEESKARQAQNVFEALESLEEFRQASTILGYWALPDELPTAEFMNKWYSHKRLLLPVVIGDDLELFAFTGAACLVPQPPFGILEPRGTELVAPESVELVIVPGVAFDTEGHRIGRGRGYYDRLFTKMPHAIRIGVCLGEQMVNDVPCEAHDLRMNYVLHGNI